MVYEIEFIISLGVDHDNSLQWSVICDSKSDEEKLEEYLRK